MNIVGLKNCPFCGGVASIWRRPSKYGLMVFVMCDTCNAQTRVKNAMPIEDRAKFWKQIAVEDVVALWNRRQCDPEIREYLEPIMRDPDGDCERIPKQESD